MQGEVGETVYGAKGTVGEQGDRGEPGPPSKDEYKKTDTMYYPVKGSRGEKGMRGDKGSYGRKGEPGIKGPHVSNIMYFKLLQIS